MSKYTMELRKVCEYYTREEVENWFKDYNLTDYLTQDEINVINERGTWTKDKLARQIVDFYYMREIGLETPALFKLYAKNRMNIIMEEKLPLIYSASIKYDPLINVDVTETYSRQINDSGNANTSSSATASGLTVNSDTPQGQISKESILGGSYASQTQAGSSENQSSDSTNTSSQSVEQSSKNTKGNSGVSATAQKMIEQYRDNIKSINRDIIDELNIIFMGLF